MDKRLKKMDGDLKKMDEELKKMDEDLTKVAIELRDEFNEAADELDRHTKNVNIARVAGGSAAVAGGVMVIIGLAMAPFTFGSSAVAAAAVAGGVVGTAGRLTATGASMAEYFIEKNKLRSLFKKWSEFIEKLKKEVLEKEPDICEMVKNELLRAEVLTTCTAAAAQTVVRDAIQGRRGAQTVARRVGAGARLIMRAAAGSVLLNVVLVGVNLYVIIDGSIQLHTETGSKAGDCLRQLAQTLDDFVRPSCDDDW